MPSGAKKQRPAGVSSVDEADVAALFARLKEEVTRTAPSRADGAAAAAGWTRWRDEAERAWPVTVDHAVERLPGPKGAAAYPVKRGLRRLMRWYVERLAADQRAFNDAALKLIDALHELADELGGRSAQHAGALDDLRARHERDERRFAELEERLLRLERRRGAAVGTTAAQPSAAAVPDYFAFESRMRGTVEEIRERQRPYVDDLRASAPVLDLGCGRGEFLVLLREAGIQARGVDADSDMVAFARGEGVEVEQADALAYLDGLEDGSLGGLFAAQLVEHLPPPSLLRLLELAAVKLRPGGLLVAETINPLAPMALRNYFADLTHAQPLVPETLVLLARQAGFGSVEVRYLNEPPAEERLAPVELPPDPELDRARAALAANVERLNEQLFCPLDYAILART